MRKGMAALMTVALGIAVGAIVIGAVTIPILNSINTTGWSSTDTTVFTYVKTFLLLSLLIGSIAGTGILFIGGR